MPTFFCVGLKVLTLADRRLIPKIKRKFIDLGYLCCRYHYVDKHSMSYASLRTWRIK